MEFIFINFKITQIEKIRQELLESNLKDPIRNFDFRWWELRINGEKFQFNANATKASTILPFICEYFEMYKLKTRASTKDLQIFLKENIKRFPSLSEQDLEIETLRTWFLRTFETNLLKKYKFNNILGRDKEHLVLIGKE